MAMISSEEVKKLAMLARIEIGSREAEEFKKELGAILDYVSQLQKAPADVDQSGPVLNGAPEIFSARGGSALGGNVFREDEPIEDGSDVKKGEHIRVKHIL